MFKFYAAATALTALLFAPSVQAKDNHFIFELEAGINAPFTLREADSQSIGGSFGGTFGWGGKLKGHAPSFYFVGNCVYSTMDYTGPFSAGGYIVERDATEFGLGGRLYLPMTESVRFMVQLAFGGTFDTSRIPQPGYDYRYIDDSAFTIFGDIGLQFRMEDHLSLGFVVSNAWYLGNESFRDAPQMVGMDESLGGQTNISLTMTFHF